MKSKVQTYNFSHFSNEPVIRHIYSTPQIVSDYRSCYEKPRGFWISVDGECDWENWCDSENFTIGDFRHRVHLARFTTILWLRTSSDLIEFRREWALETGRSYSEWYIPWERVAEQYQGIIIAPYQWSCRLEENWYYGWDCASGCIWDADAIECVEPIREAA